MSKYSLWLSRSLNFHWNRNIDLLCPVVLVYGLYVHKNLYAHQMTPKIRKNTKCIHVARPRKEEQDNWPQIRILQKIHILWQQGNLRIPKIKKRPLNLCCRLTANCYWPAQQKKFHHWRVKGWYRWTWFWPIAHWLNE